MLDQYLYSCFVFEAAQDNCPVLLINVDANCWFMVRVSELLLMTNFRTSDNFLVLLLFSMQALVHSPVLGTKFDGLLSRFG